MPDKVAAQRAAAGLHLEEDDERWGFTAARELRQRKDKDKEQAQAQAQEKKQQKAQQPTPPTAPE